MGDMLWAKYFTHLIVLQNFIIAQFLKAFISFYKILQAQCIYESFIAFDLKKVFNNWCFSFDR